MTEIDEHREPKLLHFLTFDNPLVRKRAISVDIDDPTQLAEAQASLDDMLHTLHHSKLVGIAGNQVKLPMQYDLIAIDMGKEGLPPLKLINTKIIWYSEKTEKSVESCGTVGSYAGSPLATPPGAPEDVPYAERPAGTVDRYKQVIAQAYQISGEPGHEIAKPVTIVATAGEPLEEAGRVVLSNPELPPRLQGEGVDELLKDKVLPWVFHHETDHNQGKVFIDHLPAGIREAIIQKLQAVSEGGPYQPEASVPPEERVWPLFKLIPEQEDGQDVIRLLANDERAPEKIPGVTYTKRIVVLVDEMGQDLSRDSADGPEAVLGGATGQQAADSVTRLRSGG